MAERTPHYHDLRPCYEPDCAAQRATDGVPQPECPGCGEPGHVAPCDACVAVSPRDAVPSEWALKHAKGWRTCIENNPDNLALFAEWCRIRGRMEGGGR